MGIIGLLRTERSFARLWLGQCVSQGGDWFQLVALVSLLPTHGGHVHQLAFLFIVRFLPILLFTPLAGVVADRLPRSAVMIASDLTRAVVVLGFLLVRGPEDLVLAYGLTFVLETLTVFFEPARGAAVPQLVPVEKLYVANALGNATWAAMLAIGAALGGGAVVLFGRRTAFIANSGSFLLSALLIASARVPALVRDRVPPSATRIAALSRLLGIDDLRSGLGYLRAHRPQAVLALLKGGIGLAAAGGYVLISVFADQVFTTRSEISVGALYAARGVGSLIGPFAFARILGHTPRDLRRGITLGYVVAVVAFAAFALAPGIGWASLAYAVTMAATSAVWVNSTHLLQLTTDNRFLGRLIAVELLGLGVTLVLATLGTSALASMPAVGPRGAGIGIAVATIVPLVFWVITSRRLGAELDGPPAGGVV